jgi:hypothetical protein
VAARNQRALEADVEGLMSEVAEDVAIWKLPKYELRNGLKDLEEQLSFVRSREIENPYHQEIANHIEADLLKKIESYSAAMMMRRIAPETAAPVAVSGENASGAAKIAETASAPYSSEYLRHGEPQPASDRHLDMAHRKVANPERYPHMNAHEVAAALGISRKSVYEHKGLERVATGTKKVLWSTKSVIAVKDSPPE